VFPNDKLDIKIVAIAPTARLNLKFSPSPGKPFKLFVIGGVHLLVVMKDEFK
jgi:hypothetical protein